MALLTPWTWTSSFQKYETINFCCLIPPSLGYHYSSPRKPVQLVCQGSPGGLGFWNTRAGAGMALCQCWGLPCHNPRWLMGTDSLDGRARASVSARSRCTMLPQDREELGLTQQGQHNLEKIHRRFSMLRSVSSLFSHDNKRPLLWMTCYHQPVRMQVAMKRMLVLWNFPRAGWGVWGALTWEWRASEPPLVCASPWEALHFYPSTSFTEESGSR